MARGVVMHSFPICPHVFELTLHCGLGVELCPQKLSLCSDPELGTKGSMTSEPPALLGEASSILTVLGPRGSHGCHHMLPGQALAQQMARQPSCTSPWSPFTPPARSTGSSWEGLWLCLSNSPTQQPAS